MEYRDLGNSALRISALCLGSMTWGQQNTEAEAHNQLAFAAERGINFVDTAESYPVPVRADTYTRTETIIGKWLKHQPRDQWVIASKVAGPRRALNWIRGGPTGFDAANIRVAVNGSLQRLQTDYIDLYQLHWPERNVPLFGQYQFDPMLESPALSIHSQLEVLAELVQAGKIRYIGVSNEHAWGLMEFIRLADRYQLPRIVSTQNCYNLINRSFEFGLSEIVYREKLGLLAYSPLAFGHLSAKYQDDARAAGRVTDFAGYAQRYEKPNVVPAVAAYAALARKHGLTPAQLALAYVYRRWFVTSTIVGATNMTQLAEDINAWDIQLPTDVLNAIEAIHLRYMNPAP